ncbi:autotransporter [Streptomyces fuscichromogenes]|uniref:autotransporter n=1 Tax=Streptomyces fuscichromogenes TaxID=1324013 RepID=UPI0037F882F4
MRTLLHTTAAAVGALTALLASAPPALAAGAAARDVTADVLADRDVTLTGDTVVTVPPGTTTYDGVLHGEGTLTVRGGGTLVLTRDSDFTLPRSRQRQVVRTQGGNHPYTTVTRPDPPAITIARGTTLQYGTGGGTGLIGHFPYDTPGYRLNQLNIRVDGTLCLSLTGTFNIGTISGSGLVTQPRDMWGTLDLAGTHPFSGVIDNGTGMAVGRPEYPVALPRARAVLNQGSWIIDTPLGQTITLRQDFYQRAYGSDVNVHSRPGSKVVLTGQYSYSDQGGDTDPSLSDPALNWRAVPHQLNKRGTNIEGADVHWGDGTTHRIFMPGTKDTVYVNLHEASGRRSKLTFDYDGPVTLGAPIGGGRYHDTLAAPGAGDIVIAGTRGNDVTFAAAQDYDGSTTIRDGAVLRLGSGSKGGDGSLLTGTERRRIDDDGTLVVQNTTTPVSLAHVGGSGSLVQSGTATTTLTGNAVTYTGTTTVSQGTLALRSGATLAHSEAVRLTSARARLDPGTAGLRVPTTLSGTGTVLGSVTNDSLVTSGLTVRGDYVQHRRGELVLRKAPLKVTGRVALAGVLDLSAAGTAPARRITVIDHTGRAPTTGAFDGLAEGTAVELADKVYRITYRGGDGNDVVLEGGTTRASTGADTTGTAGGAPTTAPPVTTHSAADARQAFGWWPYALALGLLGGLMIPPGLRTQRNRRASAGRGPAAPRTAPSGRHSASRRSISGKD